MRTSLLVALCSLVLNISASTRISPERLVADPRAGSPRTMTTLTVASNGSEAMTFWAAEGGLTATVVDSDGRVSDRPRPPQIPISIEPSFPDLSAVWTGTVYLVTWTHGAGAAATVRSATFSRDGTLLSGPAKVVTSALARAGALAAGPHGAFGVYLTVDTFQLRGVLFDINGDVVMTGVALPLINSQIDPVNIVRVASDGEEYAYVWRTTDDSVISSVASPRFDTLHLLRLTATGAPAAPGIKIARLETTSDFDVTYGGGKYAVIANEVQLITIGNVRRVLSRFIVDAHAGTVTPLAKMEHAGFDSVLWNGSAFIAYGAAPDASAVETLAFNSSESFVPEPVTISSLTPVLDAFIKPLDGKLLVIWNVSRALGAILDSNGTAVLSGPFLVSVASARQMTPATAASPTESVVIWFEDGGILGSALIGRRFTRGGDPIGAPFEIAAATLDEPPSITFTGVAYQAVWVEHQSDRSSRVITRSIGLDGSLAQRIDLGPGSNVTLASNNKMTLVAFDAKGYRFAPNGTLLDTQPITIANSGGGRAATNGTDFFVAWDDGHDVFGVRVFADGAVDAAALPIATGGGHSLAALAGDGRDYMIFYWSFAPNSAPVVAAKRVLREGQLDGTTAGDRGNVVATLPFAGYVSSYAVSASRDRNGFWLSWFDNVQNNGTFRLIRTDNDARPLEILPVFSYGYDPFAIATLTNAIDGPLLVAYSQSLNGTTEVFVRTTSEVTTRRRAANP